MLCRATTNQCGIVTTLGGGCPPIGAYDSSNAYCMRRFSVFLDGDVSRRGPIPAAACVTPRGYSSLARSQQQKRRSHQLFRLPVQQQKLAAGSTKLRAASSTMKATAPRAEAASRGSDCGSTAAGTISHEPLSRGKAEEKRAKERSSSTSVGIQSTGRSFT